MAQSPCVKVCIIDPGAQMCRGCFRTLPEIAQWARLGDADHQAILAQLPTREKNFNASVLREPNSSTQTG